MSDVFRDTLFDFLNNEYSAYSKVTNDSVTRLLSTEALKEVREALRNITNTTDNDIIYTKLVKDLHLTRPLAKWVAYSDTLNPVDNPVNNPVNNHNIPPPCQQPCG